MIMVDSGHTKEAMGLLRGAAGIGKGLWGAGKALVGGVPKAVNAVRKGWTAMRGGTAAAESAERVGQEAATAAQSARGVGATRGAGFASDSLGMPEKGLGGVPPVNAGVASPAAVPSYYDIEDYGSGVVPKGSWGSRLAGWGTRNPNAAMGVGAGAMGVSNALTAYGTGRIAENKYNARGQEMVNAFQNSKDKFLENEGFNSFGGRLMNGLQAILGGKQYANNLYDRYTNQYMLPQLSPAAARDFQRWTSSK